MNELQCPKCGEKFQIDEAGYAAILKQVRDKEFFQELQGRERQFESEKEQAVQVAKLETEKDLNTVLSKKDTEIKKNPSNIKPKNVVAV